MPVTENGLRYEKHPNDNGWYDGEFDYDDETTIYLKAKIFDEPSEFGIDDGRISKLAMSYEEYWWGEDVTIARYDRGWDYYPDDEEEQDMIAFAVEELETIPVD